MSTGTRSRSPLTAILPASTLSSERPATRRVVLRAATSEWVRPRDAFSENAAASTLTGAGANFRDKAYGVLAR